MSIKVTATGRLVNDAKVFPYDNGTKSGINFTIASNRMGSDEASFLDCVKFGADENLAQYMKQGDQFIVHGDLDPNKKGNDNNYYTKLIVSEIEFGAKKQR